MTSLLERGRFYGETTRHRDAGGIGLSETTHRSGDEAPPHAHAHPYVCLVLSGAFTERFGTSEVECGPGTVVFHPAGDEHADRFGRTGARCFNIQLDGALVGPLVGGGPPLARVAVGGGRAAVAAARLRTVPDDGERAREGAESVLIELMHRAGLGAARDERRPPAWLRRVVDRLQAGCGASPRVASLAAEENVHPVYLARTFRRFLGAAPLEFVQRLRLERSAAALGRTMAPIARVAADAGFADHSHFCRSFRRAYGVTPSEYRRLLSP